MKWDPVSEDDQRIIAGQIERAPRNLLGVARRCERRCPQVLVNHPLLRESGDAIFFPTLFWLSCPAVVANISRLEDQGDIQCIQKQLQPGGDFFRNLCEAQLEYIYLRNSVVDKEVLLEMRLSRPELARELDLRGIGGVGDWHAIKCLHMHYAHYLVTRCNPVGQLVEHRLRLQSFPFNCRQCWHAGNDAGVAK